MVPFEVTFADGFKVRVHATSEAGAKSNAVRMWTEFKGLPSTKAPGCSAVALVK